MSMTTEQTQEYVQEIVYHWVHRLREENRVLHQDQNDQLVMMAKRVEKLQKRMDELEGRKFKE